MGWVRFDDQRALHRKLRDAGFAARGLDEAACEMAAQDLTDGYVSVRVVNALGVAHGESLASVAKLAQRLVNADRWHRTDTLKSVPEACDGCRDVWEANACPEDGWLIHDYLAFNPSRAQEIERRRVDRLRKARSRSSGVSERTDEGQEP